MSQYERDGRWASTRCSSTSVSHLTLAFYNNPDVLKYYTAPSSLAHTADLCPSPFPAIYHASPFVQILQAQSQKLCQPSSSLEQQSSFTLPFVLHSSRARRSFRNTSGFRDACLFVRPTPRRKKETAIFILRASTHHSLGL